MVYGHQRPAQTAVCTAVRARFMVRMGPPTSGHSFKTVSLLSRELSRRGLVPPEASAWALVCEAEHSRLQARANPAHWQAAAEAWETLSQPYRAAQARWRRAEALVASGAGEEASAPLRQALATAERLNAGPLRERLERLDQQLLSQRQAVPKPAGETIARP